MTVEVLAELISKWNAELAARFDRLSIDALFLGMRSARWEDRLGAIERRLAAIEEALNEKRAPGGSPERPSQ